MPGRWARGERIAMSTLVHIHDERLARLYREAVRRNLDYELLVDEPNVMFVDSYSHPGDRYKVIHKDDQHVFCTCSTEDGLCCTHSSIAVAYWHPSIWLEWQAAERQEWAVKALKKRQAIFNGLLKERGRVAMRASKAKPDGSFEEVTAGGKSEPFLQTGGIRKAAEKQGHISI